MIAAGEEGPPAGPRADLHLHSQASDGALAPAALVAEARAAGLSVLALTDHDTTAGLAAALAAAGGALRIIPALELTCRVRPGPLGTVHVLGYGVDPSNPRLQAAAGRNRAAKQEQVRAILAALAAREGIALSWEEVAGDRPGDAYVGRNQVAAALVRRGLTRTPLKAFRRYLRAERVPAVEAIDAAEGLAAIHAAGGVAVLAHPTEQDLRHHLRPLLAQGLGGLEAHRPRLPDRDRDRLLRAAARHDLLVTGGSDWHGHPQAPPFGAWLPPAGAVAPLLARLGCTDPVPGAPGRPGP